MPLHMQKNAFGIFRVYHAKPSSYPESDECAVIISDAPFIRQLKPAVTLKSLHLAFNAETDIFVAFSTPTAGIYMVWLYSGSNLKSAMEVQ